MVKLDVNVDQLRKELGTLQLKIWELTGNDFIYDVLELVGKYLEDYETLK